MIRKNVCSLTGLPTARAFAGSMADCEKMKVVEEQMIALINDRTPLATLGDAKARTNRLDAFSSEITVLKQSCEAAKKAEREDLARKREEEAARQRQAAMALARENTPKFFAGLVDMVENGDNEMRDAIMKQVASNGQDKRIVLWSSSEWERSAHERLPRSKQLFSYFEMQGMWFGRDYRRTIGKGEFGGWSVWSEPFWKMSIFIIPTREQRIVMKDK